MVRARGTPPGSTESRRQPTMTPPRLTRHLFCSHLSIQSALLGVQARPRQGGARPRSRTQCPPAVQGHCLPLRSLGGQGQGQAPRYSPKAPPQQPYLAHGHQHPSTGRHGRPREQLLQTLCRRKGQAGCPPRPSACPCPHPCLLGPLPWVLPCQGPAPLTFSGHTVQAVQGVGVAARDRMDPREALPDLPLPWGPPGKSHTPTAGNKTLKEGPRDKTLLQQLRPPHPLGDLST